MKTTRLSVLRQSAPGSPSATEVARKIKSSPSSVSQFERGGQVFGPDKLRAYAKVLGVTEAQVRRLFLLEAQSYLRERLVEIGQELREISGKG